MRSYTRKVPIHGTVLIRLVYITRVAVVLTHFFSLNLVRLSIVSLLLIFCLLVHNFMKVKAKRIHNFANVRLSEILFVSIVSI